MAPKHENIWVPLSAQKKAPMAKGLLIRNKIPARYLLLSNILYQHFGA